ncbi:MAG: YceI family protein [Chitinophagaceae bacterium]
MDTVKWILDPAHSEITFKVRHLMISTVTGSFRKFDLVVETEGDDFLTTTNLQLTVETDSVSTNNDARDHHLKSADFFDVKEFPLFRFSGKRVFMDGESMLLEGALTLKGITKLVTAAVDFAGLTIDSYRQTKAGFSVTGKLNRKDFGLQWGALTEAGKVVVSDEVKFDAEIQLIRQVL